MRKILLKSAKFIADESLGLQVARNLQKVGLEIVAVADFARGAPDTEILLKALKEKRILMTVDKDFGFLVFKERLLTSGVVLVRLKDESIENLTKTIINFLLSYKKKLQGKFIVLSEGKVRIRDII